MTLLAMLHHRESPEKVSRAYSYASIAKIEGINFYFFSPKCVNFKNRTIDGFVYEEGQWIKRELPYPDVILNVVRPITKKQRIIYKKLRKIIPFTSNPVGSKLSIYNRIKNGKQFESYLLPYKRIKKPIDVLQFLKLYNKAIIKPILGRHGEDIVYIEKNVEGMTIKDNYETHLFNRIELLDYVNELLDKNRILIQKYISCKRKTGEPYDIRLHVQKNKEGKWVNTIIYPKIGFKGKITTNLGQGGQIIILDKFLKEEFGDDYFDTKCILEVFSLQFAKHFDTLYNHDFDELGIDVGLDENKNIWIYEVNWRPGHLYIESKTAYHAIMYALHIANKKKEGDK